MGWTTIDSESASRNLTGAGVAVVTHTPSGAQVNLPARVRLSLSGLNTAAQTLTVSMSQGGVACGKPQTLDVASTVLAAKTDVLLPSYDGGAVVISVASSNGSDTAVTVTATLQAEVVVAAEVALLTSADVPGAPYAPSRTVDTWSPIDFVLTRLRAERRIYADAAECPIARTNAYYIDPDAGNDANSGALGAPWQTIAKLVTALPTLPDDTTIYLKGDRTYYPAPGAFTVDSQTAALHLTAGSLRGVTLAAWGTGRAMLSAFRNVITPGSAWTQSASTNAYYASTLGKTDTVVTGAVMIQGERDRPLAKQTSQANCEATTDSWYFDAVNNRLYLNIGGADPDTYGRNVAYCIASAGTCVAISQYAGSRTRLAGIDTEGWEIAATNSHQYGYKCIPQNSADAITVVSDCDVTYGNAYHLAGSYSNGANSGGTVTLINCGFGWFTPGGGAGARGWNAFASAGGNTFRSIGRRMLYGVLPSGTGAYSRAIISAADGHTGTGTLAEYTTLDTVVCDGPYAAMIVDICSNLPVPSNPDDPSTYMAMIMRPRAILANGASGAENRTGYLMPAVENALMLEPDYACVLPDTGSQSPCRNAMTLGGDCLYWTPSGAGRRSVFNPTTPLTDLTATLAGMRILFFATGTDWTGLVYGCGFTSVSGLKIVRCLVGAMTGGALAQAVFGLLAGNTSRLRGNTYVSMDTYLGAGYAGAKTDPYRGWSADTTGRDVKIAPATWSPWAPSTDEQRQLVAAILLAALSGPLTEEQAATLETAAAASAEALDGVQVVAASVSEVKQRLRNHTTTVASMGANTVVTPTVAPAYPQAYIGASIKIGTFTRTITAWTPDEVEEGEPTVPGYYTFTPSLTAQAQGTAVVIYGDVQAAVVPVASLLEDEDAGLAAINEAVGEIGTGNGDGSGAYSASHPGPDRVRRAKVYNTSAGTYLDPLRLGAEESCWFGVNFEGTAGGPLARVISATVLGYAEGDTPPVWELVPNGDDAGTIDVEGARTASVQFTGHEAGHKARVRIVAQGVNGKRYEETVTVEVH